MSSEGTGDRFIHGTKNSFTGMELIINKMLELERFKDLGLIRKIYKF
jgi:hypothetical protein